MSFAANQFIKLLRHPIKFRLFLLMKLPAAYFSGVRIRAVDEAQCTVSVPYKWLTRNPFRSTYFASLSMAAEMSTGVLSLAHIYKRKPAVSMLVVKVVSTYTKKATGITRFTCSDGKAIQAIIEKAVTTGEGQSFDAHSIGKNENGEVVAEFVVTWSYKVKK